MPLTHVPACAATPLPRAKDISAYDLCRYFTNIKPEWAQHLIQITFDVLEAEANKDGDTADVAAYLEGQWRLKLEQPRARAQMDRARRRRGDGGRRGG